MDDPTPTEPAPNCPGDSEVWWGEDGIDAPIWADPRPYDWPVQETTLSPASEVIR
jgi:hypothetical protein